MDDDDLVARRRRCLYRAEHRGTKEMDWLLGQFAADQLPHADTAALAAWEELVQIPDPQLYDWIMGHEVVEEPRIAGIVQQIRTYHCM